MINHCQRSVGILISPNKVIQSRLKTHRKLRKRSRFDTFREKNCTRTSYNQDIPSSLYMGSIAILAIFVTPDSRNCPSWRIMHLSDEIPSNYILDTANDIQERVFIWHTGTRAIEYIGNRYWARAPEQWNMIKVYVSINFKRASIDVIYDFHNTRELSFDIIS